MYFKNLSPFHPLNFDKKNSIREVCSRAVENLQNSCRPIEYVGFWVMPPSQLLITWLLLLWSSFWNQSCFSITFAKWQSSFHYRKYSTWIPDREATRSECCCSKSSSLVVKECIFSTILCSLCNIILPLCNGSHRCYVFFLGNAAIKNQ